jgi:N-methylhydantoinase A
VLSVANSWKIGIDVGGTFTDFTLFEETTNQLFNYKTPSTPNEPAEAVELGLVALINDYNIDPLTINYLGHGTTVALNMLLEHRAKSIGLLTTKGFRDVLEIGRQTRPNLYDYEITRPEPLALRSQRIEVTERINVDGQIITPLDHKAVEEAALHFLKNDIEAIAICFLHAYKYPDHEIQAAQILKDKLPNAFVSLSSEVLPEFREYERTSTTAVNTYVGPRMKLYIQQLKERITKIGIKCSPYIIHSNGGLLTIPTATKFPVKTCLSGPAAGVVGAATIAQAANHPNLIAFDVGGTSTDVSLILEGNPLFTLERSIAGFPIKSPSIDVSAIGAGGGSIAWLDEGGALKVGPNSAGADPGPIAYNKGGQKVTLTDANLILGRLNPNALLGGQISMNIDAAKTAIEEQIANPLSLSIEAAALGIIKVAASGIARAIRSVASTKGLNPLDFSLFAYGGAGPLLATVVNEEVGSKIILIPPNPGTICARGILLSDRSFDFVQTVIATLENKGWDQTLKAFHKLMTHAEHWFVSENIPQTTQFIKYYIEARYLGQSFEVRVEPSIAPQNMTQQQFIAAFNEEHRKQYGYDIQNRSIEIVNCRLEAIERINKPPIHEKLKLQKNTTPQHRTLYCGSSLGWENAVVYDRQQLSLGQSLQGPAIIEEMSSTTFVPYNYLISIDEANNIVMKMIQ